MMKTISLSKKKKRKKTEESLQMALSRFVQHQYKTAIFTAESAGRFATIGVAVKAKQMRSSAKLPDFLLLEPRGPYAGLVLELKTPADPPFLKDGSISTKKHITAQAAVLEKLNRKGYMAMFAVGLDEAIQIVKLYFKLPSWDKRKMEGS